ncbi:unnamed protein product, partial [Rotaria magnacalcarata]
LIQRVPVAPECQAPVYERQAKVVHLKPPPPEPSGVSFIQTHILLPFLLNLISSILLIAATHCG